MRPCGVGWVGGGGGKGGLTSELIHHSPESSHSAERFRCDIPCRWIDGAKDHHNLTIDWIGLWNEHPPTPDYAVLCV